MIKLSDIVKVNDDFKNAININLNLNKMDKIKAYIPTKSSTSILLEMTENILFNRNQANLLIGSYGKGKSHLMLILLSVISLERKEENSKTVFDLTKRIRLVNPECANNIEKIWNNKKRYLPIIINNSYNDMNQAFLIALNDAIKKAKLDNLKPTTYFDAALNNIDQWKSNYENTFNIFKSELRKINISYESFIVSMKKYDNESLQFFIDIYPKLTSGSSFSPMINQEIQKLYKDILTELKKSNDYCGMYIVFDEFSKFIESKDKSSAGNDMKIIQDICELANESKIDNQLMITMVAHKSIKEYGDYLNKNTINSFLGIQGRIKENYFITSPKNNYELIKNAIYKDEIKFKKLIESNKYFKCGFEDKYYEIPVFRSNYDASDFRDTVFRGCYPLNPISAYCLVNVSEKVAQNERTLFTFISKNERNSMANYVLSNENLEEEKMTANLNLIYDYFSNIFKEDTLNYYVHDIWLKSEYILDKDIDEVSKNIIKAIAIIKIVNNNDELTATSKNIALSLNMSSIEKELNDLCEKQLIKIRNDLNYDFVTLNNKRLNREIKSRDKKKTLTNVVATLNSVSQFDFEYPKKYNNENAITRFVKYEFMWDTEFLRINNSNTFFDSNEFSDGKIILILKSDSKISDIRRHVKELSENRIIFLYPNKKIKCDNLIRNIEILRDIEEDKEFIKEHPILSREIELCLNEAIENVNKDVEDVYNVGASCKALIWKNDLVEQKSKCSVNSLVSYVLENAYPLYPVINNELINKNNLSSTIKRAQKNIIDIILNETITEDMFNKTSADDTIFRAVLRNTCITSDNTQENMKIVLNEISKFYDVCVENKTSFETLISKLISKPFGMRKGVIPIILAYTLRNKKKDFVIYKEEKEVEINSEVLNDLTYNSGKYVLFVSKNNDQKQFYMKSFVELFSDTIINDYDEQDTRVCIDCLKKWYRSLPQITKNIDDDEYYSSILKSRDLKKFRNLIIHDENPYELLFIKIPEIMDIEKDYVELIKQLKLLKLKMDEFYLYMNKRCVEETFIIFNKKESLYNVLIEWYKNQSEKSKLNLYENEITGFMNYLSSLSNFNDEEIVKDIIRITTSSYFENWNNESLENYTNNLKLIKNKIECIKDDGDDKNKKYFKYLDANNNEIVKYYDNIQDSQANILKNVIEGDIDDFYNLSTNDKAAVLVEMLDKILKG